MRTCINLYYEFNKIKLNTKYNLFNKINQYINITKCQIEEKIRNIKNEKCRDLI